MGLWQSITSVSYTHLDVYKRQVLLAMKVKRRGSGQNKKASKIAERLRETVCRNKHLTGDGKVRIYKWMVRPVNSYKPEPGLRQI